jgi:hypothetical protein
MRGHWRLQLPVACVDAIGHLLLEASGRPTADQGPHGRDRRRGEPAGAAYPGEAVIAAVDLVKLARGENDEAGTVEACRFTRQPRQLLDRRSATFPRD